MVYAGPGSNLVCRQVLNGHCDFSIFGASVSLKTARAAHVLAPNAAQDQVYSDAAESDRWPVDNLVASNDSRKLRQSAL